MISEGDKMTSLISRKKENKVKLKLPGQNSIWLYLMILPGLIAMLIFSYKPLYGLIIAFKDFNILDGYLNSPWVGFKHFKNLFNSDQFARLMRNTFVIGFSSYIITFFPPIILAILLHELRFNKFKRTIQTISYLPYFIPMVVVVGIMYQFFGSFGIVNDIRNLLGLPSISFLSEKSYFLPLYIGSSIWKGIGWGSIIYMGTLTNIDPQLYEAAMIDGATRFQRIRHVTIPTLIPIMTTIFILDAGGIMSVGFEKVYLMYSPATYEVADVLSTYVYRLGIESGDYSYSAAVGLFNNLLSTSMVLICNFIAKRLGQDGIV